MNSSCPCCSRKEFDVCCGPVLAGAPAATAEALMRSRYTAFSLGDIDYLEATNAKRVAATFNRSDLELQNADTEWLGLEIRSTEAGGEGDETGSVVFAATYSYSGRTFTQVERSEFIRVGGLWRYEWGDVELEKKQPNNVRKVGRNDPCPCDSGQKYKKCCGK